MKPLLLMDVDGPMNPFRVRWFARGAPAGGYEFHALTPEGDQTYSVALNPGTWPAASRIGRGLRLGVGHDLGGGEANRLIAPILGLPSDLPVIDLPEPSTLMSRRSSKAERIVDWVGQRPFAWFDDEINRPTRLWLDSQDILGPHLAHRVPAEVGLTDTDFDVLWDFANNP